MVSDSLKWCQIRVRLDYCLRALVLPPLKPDWSMNGQMILTLMMIVAAIVTWGLLTSYSLLINPTLPCIPCIPTHASYHCSLAELAKLLRNSAPLEHNKSLAKQIIKWKCKYVHYRQTFCPLPICVFVVFSSKIRHQRCIIIINTNIGNGPFCFRKFKVFQIFKNCRK